MPNEESVVEFGDFRVRGTQASGRVPVAVRVLRFVPPRKDHKPASRSSNRQSF